MSGRWYIINCPVCKNENHQKIYTGKIRNGSYGKYTTEEHDIFQCSSCETVFLDRNINGDFYESEAYREAYNDEASIEQYQLLHDALETDKLALIGIHNFRDKIVADFGSGGGSFLDACNGIAAQTIAIEPSNFFHQHLSQKHKVFSYGSDLVKSGTKIDIATSFDVVEHVPDPLAYLEDIYKTLKSECVFYLMTPNFDEVLRDLIPEEFQQFDYRTAHLFYFNARSITFALKKAGFTDIEVGYHHKRDISNLLLWLRDKKPTGDGKYTFFDEEMNFFYKKYLEKHGKASHLFIKSTRK